MATTVPPATAVGAGPTATTVEATTTTAMGTEQTTKLEPGGELATTVEEMTVRGDEE